MATWQPQRSKQNCLAAQPEPPLKGFSVYPGPPPGGLAGALAHAPSSRGGPGLGPTDGFRSPNQHPNLKKPEWTWAEEGQEVAGGCMEAAPPTGLERKRRGWGQEVERGTHSEGGTGPRGWPARPQPPLGASHGEERHAAQRGAHSPSGPWPKDMLTGAPWEGPRMKTWGARRGPGAGAGLPREAPPVTGGPVSAASAKHGILGFIWDIK